MAAETDAAARIALIGLGSAGSALLQGLAASRTVHVYDRAAERRTKLPACAHPPVVAANAAEAARDADLVILALPTPAASLAVADEIRQAVGPQTLVLESSTVRPEDVETVHALLSPTGARVLDGAMIGGVHKLAEGQGVFLVGAPEAEAGLAGEVLRSIAAEIFFLARRGDGMRAKLIVNAVAHAVYVVLVEAGALAATQDIPLSVIRRLLARESGLMRPLTHRFGERLGAHDFEGGMSTLNARKDSGLILDQARALGVPLFAIQAAHTAFELGVREGLGELDYASIGQLWEKWLNVSLEDESLKR